MKRITFILMILILTLILLTSSGCFTQKDIEFNREKKEIIKSDNEFQKITKEYGKILIDLEERYTEVWDNQGKHKADSDLLYQDLIEEKKLMEEHEKDVSEYFLKFKSINIPKPLDGFYDKKIEQFNNYQMYVIKRLEYLNLSIPNWENMNEKTVKELDGIYKESVDYYNKNPELKLESEKLIFEVYRKYGLDYLINNWQE